MSKWIPRITCTCASEGGSYHVLISMYIYRSAVSLKIYKTVHWFVRASWIWLSVLLDLKWSCGGKMGTPLPEFRDYKYTCGSKWISTWTTFWAATWNPTKMKTPVKWYGYTDVHMYMITNNAHVEQLYVYRIVKRFTRAADEWLYRHIWANRDLQDMNKMKFAHLK